MTALAGEAREVVLAEAQAVHAMAVDERLRDRFAELVGDAADGELGPDAAAVAESLLELGLQSGRIRAVYGPGGEQKVLETLRRLPRGRDRDRSAREVSAALRALEGSPVESIGLRAVAPGAFALEVAAGGFTVAVRLDARGARLASVGT